MEIASSNFPQQGQVDWVALSSSSLTFTRDLLARLAKADIHPNTVATGRVLFSAFSVAPRVQNEMLEVLKTLKSFQSYGNLIWFGFGVKSLVRDLADSEQGLACVALCSCLSMSYGSFFAGTVLRDFAKHRGALTEFIPSVHQWSTLVDLCAGSMAGSKFPSLLEGLIRLAIPRTDPSSLKPTSSGALSRALNIVADISHGKLARATFVGGLDCLWLAALSEWLLSLKVEIINAEKTIYLSSTANTYGHSQVVIILDSTDEWKAGPLLDRKWHIIPTGSKLLDIPKLGTPTFSGTHSDWTTILRDTFGSSFSKLIDESIMDQVGVSLIASCCEGRNGRSPLQRVLRLDTSTNWRFSPRHPQWSTLCEFVSSRLPELAGIMDKCGNLKGEARDLDLPTSQIKQFCPCTSCREGKRGSEKEPFCLRTVVETIATFLCIIGVLEVETSLLPCPAGLRILYMRFRTSELGSWFEPKENILLITLEIFTGKTQRADNVEIPDSSALGNDGICVFYRALEDLDLSPEEAFKLRVVQGHIEFEGSARARVGAFDELEYPYRFDINIPEPGPHVSYSLIVEETPHSKVINAAYRVLGCPQPRGSLVNIPILADHYANQRKSMFRCSKDCSHARRSVDALGADINHPMETMSLNLGWSVIQHPSKTTITVVQAGFPRLYQQLNFQLPPGGPGPSRPHPVGPGRPYTVDPHTVEIADVCSCLPCLVRWCKNYHPKNDTVKIKLRTPCQPNQWKLVCTRSPQFDLIPLPER
ncbi:hypothetical protein FQN50_002704 [Emmonsiellopsis sp. PD_5]|nr:hypothetical protein FQN50_002704 [Emmonsiellopsis sp. PD_5]